MPTPQFSKQFTTFIVARQMGFGFRAPISDTYWRHCRISPINGIALRFCLRIGFLWLAPRWFVNRFFNQGKQLSKASNLCDSQFGKHVWMVCAFGWVFLKQRLTAFVFCNSGAWSPEQVKLLQNWCAYAPCLHLCGRHRVCSFKTRKFNIHWW